MKEYIKPILEIAYEKLNCRICTSFEADPSGVWEREDYTEDDMPF